MDRSNLIIGAYYFNESLHTDAGLADLTGAGFRVLVGEQPTPTLLDLCAKYGVGILAGGQFPSWWGNEGEKAGGYRDAMPLEKLDKIAAAYPQHPALWGDYPVDEPNAKDFPHIGKVVERYRELLPGKLPFVNLYPNYASVRQLGAQTYAEHIAAYVRDVPTDYIAFDAYPFQVQATFEAYLENLDIVADACRKSGRDMWVVTQLGAWQEYRRIEEYQIRWQLYLCLAFGARAILHACYCKGWWNEGTTCIDNALQKTRTYDHAKVLNAELHALSPVYMPYRFVGAAACGSPGAAEARVQPQLAAQTARNQTEHPFALPDGVSVRSEQAILAGCFVKDGGQALLLVNTQDPFRADADARVTLQAPGKQAAAYLRGHRLPVGPDADGAYHFTLTSGDGVFITMEDK